jgi:hypothetical protein
VVGYLCGVGEDGVNVLLIGYFCTSSIAAEVKMVKNSLLVGYPCRIGKNGLKIYWLITCRAGANEETVREPVSFQWPALGVNGVLW